MNEIDERKKKMRSNLLLLKEYCETFGLKPTTDGDVLKRWSSAYGPIVAATFTKGTGEAPVAWVTPDGDLFFEQDEDLLQPNEPAVAVLEESLVRVSINSKQPIHPID